MCTFVKKDRNGKVDVEIGQKRYVQGRVTSRKFVPARKKQPFPVVN